MMQNLRATLRGYRAIALMVPKLWLAYRAWFWAQLFVQLLALTIYVYFWRAVYGEQTTIAGLPMQQTLNYIMWGQILLPVVQSALVFRFGQMLVEGQFAIELLRPLDLQSRFYTEAVGFLVIHLAQKLPLVFFAWWAFDLELPTDPGIWAIFLLTLLLGHAAVFCFDWIFACLAFYTTEGWGLAMVQHAVATFFSGALVPLAIMPLWLQKLTLSLPFAQAVYVPVSLLTGITSPAAASRIVGMQLVWILGLVVVSRWIFRTAVRKVTVQGG